ncbi:MAG: hypothetical protein ABEL76_00030 [Bradymonadaceae bacterium]
MRSLVTYWGLAVLLVPAVGAAADDDPDGSRPEARSMPLDERRTDRLEPPEDASDWRYLQVERASTLVVELEVEGESGEPAATLTVESASGDVLDTSEVGEDGFRLERSVGPGVYYLRVASEGPVEYTLSVSAQSEGDSPSSSGASE